MKNIKIKELTVEEFKRVVSETIKEAFEDLLEDLIALNSENYLNSIEETRKDFKEGRVKKLDNALDV